MWAIQNTASAQTNCAQHYLDQTEPIVMNKVFKSKAREICYTNFVVMHSGLTKTAMWTSEILKRENLFKKSVPREDNFHEEDQIPASERATLDDYRGSGYDRGHLVPNGDMQDRQSKNETFSLANMIPQNSQNNRVLWEGVESSVRSMAKNQSDLYVITGPLFMSGRKTINGRVYVPSHIYKLVYSIKEKKAAAYLVKNEETLDYEMISVAKLEELSGYNFFPKMSENQKLQLLKLPSPQISTKNKNFNTSSNTNHQNDLLSSKNIQKAVWHLIR